MGIGGLGGSEILLIFLIILLLFGSKKIPEVGRSLGKGIREFKRATREISSEIDLDEESDKEKPVARRERSSSESSGEKPPAG